MPVALRPRARQAFFNRLNTQAGSQSATMCYMPRNTRRADESVGVRELRQNLSVYLRRVATGTVFRVSDRGREVALLVPLPAHATTVDRLVAGGRALPARRDLLSLGPPRARARASVSDALRAVRDDTM